MKKLKQINFIQFYIQLVTASLFAYVAVVDGDCVKMAIAILLLASWVLGFWRHRIVRRRMKISKYKNRSN